MIYFEIFVSVVAWSVRPENHMTPIEILRQIIAATDEGPGACLGHEANGATVWKGSFRSLLWEAHDVVTAASPTKADSGGIAGKR